MLTEKMPGICVCTIHKKRKRKTLKGVMQRLKKVEWKKRKNQRKKNKKIKLKILNKLLKQVLLIKTKKRKIIARKIKTKERNKIRMKNKKKTLR